MSEVNQSAFEALAAQVDKLAAYEAIRQCIYRVNRGIDRADRDLLLSGYHADAQVCWGTPAPVPLAEWVEAGLAMQQKTQRASHLVGNVLIDLEGDEARVESYEIGRHLTPLPDGMKDLIIASRYLDRFARRDGVWRIAARTKVVDWIRIMEGSDPLFDHGPAGNKGTRGASDPSFRLLGSDVFAPPYD